VKLLQTKGGTFVFLLHQREKELLVELLKLYPLTPPAHCKVSKAADPEKMTSAQQLLEEALAEQRLRNKEQVGQMLADPERFEETERGVRFGLTLPQLNWLLEVLNDIRIGSWVLLGEPWYEELKQLKLSLKNARYVWAMELAGHFQAELLEALEGQ
jgi:hypothetical protein